MGDTYLRRVLPPAFATAYFREKDNGCCTTGEKAVVCFLLHQSSSLPIRLAGQVCKRQCCNSLTVRADDMSANPPSSDRKAVVLRIMRLSRRERGRSRWGREVPSHRRHPYHKQMLIGMLEGEAGCGQLVLLRVSCPPPRRFFPTNLFLRPNFRCLLPLLSRDTASSPEVAAYFLSSFPLPFAVVFYKVVGR